MGVVGVEGRAGAGAGVGCGWGCVEVVDCGVVGSWGDEDLLSCGESVEDKSSSVEDSSDVEMADT